MPPKRVYARDLPPGWSVDATRDAERLPRQAVFVTSAPVKVGDATHARVTLGFDGGPVSMALGRFRLSATSSDQPAQIVAIRAKTRGLLAVPAAARTTEQRDAVRAEYRADADSLASVRKRIDEITEELSRLGVVSALVLRERQSHDRPSTMLRERGAYLSPGERVYANTPAALPPMTDDEMPNRLGLARWLVSPSNPLTARVSSSSAAGLSRPAKTSARRARRRRTRSCSTGWRRNSSA
jgi:hypothetical protein